MPMEEFTMLIIATCAHSGRGPRQALHRIPQHRRWPGIEIGRGCIISTPCVVPLLREDKTTVAQYVCLSVCLCMYVCIYVLYVCMLVSACLSAYACVMENVENSVTKLLFNLAIQIWKWRQQQQTIHYIFIPTRRHHHHHHHLYPCICIITLKFTC